MNPVLNAILLSWDWRVDVMLVLAVAGTLYTRGWRLLRARTGYGAKQGRKFRHRGQWPLAAGWRLAAYLGGLFFIGLSLLSPIDALGRQLFFMHMIQHLLLIMIAPPLLLVANPMPVILWGLPDKWRLKVGQFISRLLHRKSLFRQGLLAATKPGIIWLLWVVALIGWHDPTLYNAALRDELIHDVEHLSFFIASMLLWWHITGAGPHIHKQLPAIARVAAVIAAVPPNMILGVFLAFASEPIYTYYLSVVPRIWSISVIDDQRLGGVIMWIPGSMMYVIAALILISRWLQNEDNKPSLPESEWATEDALIAPGVKK